MAPVDPRPEAIPQIAEMAENLPALRAEFLELIVELRQARQQRVAFGLHVYANTAVEA
jgi:hypothetical protein